MLISNRWLVGIQKEFLTKEKRMLFKEIELYTFLLLQVGIYCFSFLPFEGKQATGTPIRGHQACGPRFNGSPGAATYRALPLPSITILEPAIQHRSNNVFVFPAGLTALIHWRVLISYILEFKAIVHIIAARSRWV
jgi:hypothetical protein